MAISKKPREIPLARAKSELTTLVRAVERGQQIRLTRRGKPVAVLVSVAEHDRLVQAGEDTYWRRLEAFRATHAAHLTDLEGVWDDVRDQSPGRDLEL